MGGCEDSLAALVGVFLLNMTVGQTCILDYLNSNS